MKKPFWEPDEEDEIAEGLTWGEAKKLLPKVDLKALMALPPDKMALAMQSYTIARVFLEYIAGNPAMVPLVAKLNIDPLVARAKIQMIVNPGGKKPGAGLSFEGPKSAAERLFERAISGDVHLPEGNFEVGMRNLTEGQDG